jgi:hypothetical protein
LPLLSLLHLHLCLQVCSICLLLLLLEQLHG